MGARERKAVSSGRRKGRLLVVGVLLVLIGGYIGYRLRLRALIGAEQQAIRDAGYPATLAELNEDHTDPPPGCNAAAVYMDAFHRCEERNFKFPGPVPLVGDAELPPGAEPLAQDTGEAIAEFLAENEEVLQLLHKAAELKQFRYPVDMLEGPDMLVHHHYQMIHCNRALCLEAVWNAENGDADKATASLMAAFALGRALRQEPLWNSVYIGSNCYSSSPARAMKRMLAQDLFSDSQLSLLSEALLEGEDLAAWGRAIAGEACFIHYEFTAWLEKFQLPHNLRDRAAWAVYVGSGLREIEHLQLLRSRRRLLVAWPVPFPDAISPMNEASAQFDHSILLDRFIQPLTSGYYSGDGDAFAGSVARIRTVRTALAVERYRLANGTLPAGLADLAPDYLEGVPEDPFDGGPLRYKTLSNGYVVYSIGWNGSDDGGTEERAAGEGGPPDLIFTVEH